LNFQVFARENCPICTKAQQVLARVGVEPMVRYVDGPEATPDNVADLAWHDWVDSPPLVLASVGDKVVGRWDGDDIRAAWLPKMQDWLSQHKTDDC
jgi:hypothetical protein